MYNFCTAEFLGHCAYASQDRSSPSTPKLYMGNLMQVWRSGASCISLNSVSLRTSKMLVSPITDSSGAYPQTRYREASGVLLLSWVPPSLGLAILVWSVGGGSLKDTAPAHLIILGGCWLSRISKWESGEWWYPTYKLVFWGSSCLTVFPAVSPNTAILDLAVCHTLSAASTLSK